MTVLASMSEDDVDLSQPAVNFKTPEDLAFAVEVENVSHEPIKLLDTRYGDSYGDARGEARSDWFAQFLFSIDFFDEAGTIIARPNVELLDSHFAAGGAHITTLEPGGTHKFLLRPTKWLSVMTQRLAAGKLQAIVHYHGLPDSAAKRIREYRPDSGVLSAWSGDVVSLLTAVEIAGPINDAVAEPSWGEASHGLRAAVELAPRKSQYAYGEKVELKLHLQNVGEEPISFANHLWLSDMRATVTNDQGDLREVGSTWYSGWTLSGRITLQPQQIAILDAGNLAFAETNGQASGIGHVTNRTMVAPVGIYRLRLSESIGRSFVLRNGKGLQLLPIEGDWTGELSTGLTEFKVVAD